MAAPAPSPTGVYPGAVRLGEIIDRGHGRVEAWLLVGDDLVSLGGHRDRTAGMRAVSADAVQRRQKQPSEWQSGLRQQP
jgi:hypothetical protein